MGDCRVEINVFTLVYFFNEYRTWLRLSWTLSNNRSIERTYETLFWVAIAESQCLAHWCSPPVIIQWATSPHQEGTWFGYQINNYCIHTLEDECPVTIYAATTVVCAAITYHTWLISQLIASLDVDRGEDTDGVCLRSVCLFPAHCTYFFSLLLVCGD